MARQSEVSGAGRWRPAGLAHSIGLLGNIVDQGLSSATNLLVSLFAAHLLGIKSFGAVGVAMATYFVFIGLGRAAIGDPLLLSRAEPGATARDTVDQAVSASFGLGVAFAALCAALSYVLGGYLAGVLLVLGAGMPFLLAQDVARYIAFQRGTPWVAAANDLLWLVGSLGTLALLLPAAHDSAARVLACWVGAGSVAGVVFVARLRWRPGVRAGWVWMRTHRRLIGPLLGDYGLIALLQQGVIYVITGVAGLRATAAFRGASVALGPVNVLTAGVSVFLVQNARRSFDTAPASFPLVMFRRSALMALAVTTLCLGVYFMPTRLGELLLSDVWDASRPLVLPLSLVLATAALNFGATTGLRVIGEAARSFRVRMIVAPLMLGIVAAACYWEGVLAAVAAQAASGVVATGLWWWTFVTAHRRLAPA